MGAFKIEIVGVGGHGCERKAKPGEKLFGRCGRFNCPDCVAFDFVQTLRQKGMVREENGYSVQVDAADVERLQAEGHTVTEEMEYAQNPVSGQYKPTRGTGKFWRQVPQSALFTHWPEQPSSVVDDMLKNERKSGQF